MVPRLLRALLLSLTVLTFIPLLRVAAQAPPIERRDFIPAPWDEYLQQRVKELSSPAWQDQITPDNWTAIQSQMREQLQGMLGLNPWPARSDLHPEVTGTVQGDGYVVEKLHFQSLPGLYVTANLYRPQVVSQPLPTILYVCGHSAAVEGGVSFGNKTGYQHHGIWFARHGYVCLIIDTIQWGEIRGEHWGTYKLGRWWWAARGYTPAGVETWNSMRALDYLETRLEVDRERIGMTGRSGGGAYSWWVAALDDRIKVAAPTAGITTLKNHVLDGAIEGHCDCMFMVNTERWDFDRVAALVAPRPLLISNTDKDEIFPLDGVMEIYNRTRLLYRKLGQEGQIGLQLAEGPHQDTQPLNTGAFHWFDRFLKGANPMDLTDEPARKALAPRDLRVFTQLPKDETVTAIDNSFVPATFVPELPFSAKWAPQRDQWVKELKTDCFRAWPEKAPLHLEKVAESTADRLKLTEYSFTSEEPFEQRLWFLQREDLRPDELDAVILHPLDESGWEQFRGLAATAFPGRFSGAKPDQARFEETRQLLLATKTGLVYTCPRGVAGSKWAGLSERKQTHLRRRLLLLGETLESGQVWDIQQAAAAVRSLPGVSRTPLNITAQNAMAANALYAALFIPDVERLELRGLSSSHRSGPTYLNVLRHLDLPQAVALAAERSNVRVFSDQADEWRYPTEVVEKMKWNPDRFQLRTLTGNRAREE